MPSSPTCSTASLRHLWLARNWAAPCKCLPDISYGISKDLFKVNLRLAIWPTWGSLAKEETPICPSSQEATSAIPPSPAPPPASLGGGGGIMGQIGISDQINLKTNLNVDTRTPGHQDTRTPEHHDTMTP